MSKRTLMSLSIISFIFLTVFLVSSHDPSKPEYEDYFFLIPKDVDEVVIISTNYTISPKYVDIKQKSYSKKVDIDKFKRTFKRLKRKDSRSSGIVGDEMIIINFKKKQQKVSSFSFHSDYVIKDKGEYTVNSHVLFELLEEVKID